MSSIKFDDAIDIRDVGHSVQIIGVILSTKKNDDAFYLLPFPDETVEADSHDVFLAVEMTTPDWERFLYQSDALEVELTGPTKALVRKSQRQIDQNVAWAVYQRDGYICRYCGKKGPLTVDHIICWEDGGPSVQDNLLASCRKCNRTRGNMPYKEWINSERYRTVNVMAPLWTADANRKIVDVLPQIEKLKVSHVRSR